MVRLECPKPKRKEEKPNLRDKNWGLEFPLIKSMVKCHAGSVTYKKAQGDAICLELILSMAKNPDG
jgi:hypothetical protein